jgi:hypothetical protein
MLNKQFYLLHIPKTGGTSVSLSISNYLNEAGLSFYPNKRPPHDPNLDSYAYIGAHMGRNPIELIPNLSVGCLLRDPILRSISNFLWIKKTILDEKYKDVISIEDKLRKYLFDDLDYMEHYNIQTRFICNKQLFSEPFDYKIWSQNWYLENNLDLNFAKSELDSFDIVGVQDNHRTFTLKVHDWFDKNYGFRVEYNTDRHDLKSTNSNYLLSTLTKLEKQKILENNFKDYELYLYAKQKQ